MVNYNELFQKSKQLERKYHLTHYELLQRFMFERILERISNSQYKENFILKGGLLLSAIFGIESRTTRDMDTTIRGLNISKKKMIKILKEILSIDLKDGVSFEVVNIEDIRETEEYGGNKYKLIGKLENLKVLLEIDISTGDIITPKELQFKYPLLFENRNIYINTYNIETILAEKIETILRRGQYNARMKDFYDVNFILTKLKNEINIKVFEKAIKNTFKNRGSLNSLKDYNQILDSIVVYERIQNYWNSYKNKNIYAKEIEFNDIILNIKEFVRNII